MPNPEKRLKILREAGPNTWLALSDDESMVIAKGQSYEDVIREAEDAGIADPLILRTPCDWTPLVLTSGR